MQRSGREVVALDRDGLLALIAELHAVISHQEATIAQREAIIGDLTQRIQELEARLSGRGGPTGMPGLKPTSSKRPPRKTERKPRPQGYARRRATPTDRVEHRLDKCPECDTPLTGGSVHHTREVIDIPVAPAKVVEHVYIVRECPICRKRRVPKVELEGEVVGHQRLGINLMSLIATLREEARLPVRSIQKYLRTFHQLDLSVGAIVDVCQRVAAKAKGAVERIRDRIRISAVVHGDETGWRQDGANGYVWTFSTLGLRYFRWGNRAKEMIDKILGEGCLASLVSDFYAAYNHYTGLKQRCWSHLLRDIHDLTVAYPDDAGLGQWAQAVHALYAEAKAFTNPDQAARCSAQLQMEQRLLDLCRPFLDEPAVAQAKLCRRIERFIKELFVFVADPAVPSDNNAAERSLRHLVTIRKISGGTRSAKGTETRMTLASLFGTWRVQDINPFFQCRLLLSSP